MPQRTLVFPGNFGVMDWGGIAIDPVRQIAFGHPNYMAFVDQLIPRDPTSARYDPSAGPKESPDTPQGPAGGSEFRGSDRKGYNPNYGAPFAVALNPFLSPLVPCQSPPWGYVAGIDLTTGKVVWQHRNGTTRDQAPVPLPFKLGVPSLGGPIVTARRSEGRSPSAPPFYSDTNVRMLSDRSDASVSRGRSGINAAIGQR